MMAERVILIDDNDNVIGHASKKECALLWQLELQPYTTVVVLQRHNHARPSRKFVQLIC